MMSLAQETPDLYDCSGWSETNFSGIGVSRLLRTLDKKASMQSAARVVHCKTQYISLELYLLEDLIDIQTLLAAVFIEAKEDGKSHQEDLELAIQGSDILVVKLLYIGHFDRHRVEKP